MTNFLDFNGNQIYFTLSDGQYWIAIKPICDALDVEYTRIFKNLKKDNIFNQLLAEQPIVAADNRLRKMTCLPEKYIYGWLMSVRSESQALKEYKLKCYDILFQHFKGSIIQRREIIHDQSILKNEIRLLKWKLLENDDYRKLIAKEEEFKSKNKSLKDLDKNISSNQIEIF